MSRSLWTGSISFGLVSVPVRLFSATQSKELRFHFLDRRDLSPIGYDKINKKTGKHVDPEQIVRGFEFEKGRFVEVDDDDIDRLDVELTHAIDICEFVSTDEIDPLFFRNGYYLLPLDGAEKPYRLLLDALEQTGQAAIAKIVIRDKQHLACVRPHGGALVLQTMYYSDEITLPDEVAKPAVSQAEKKMAKSLVENLAAEWKPEKYHDQYRTKLLDLLSSKAEDEPLPEPDDREPGQVVDLMEALRQSVQATQRKRARATSSRKSSSKTAAARKRSTRKTA